jgi:hypothetical protein
MSPTTTVYELDLLENGLDFVQSGIEIYFSRRRPKPNSHKYAILHVFSGMLLLLKERLARIRPSLVFKCEAKAGRLGAKTTDYHTTLGRLEENGIRIDPAKRSVLDEIQALRNAMEHYRFELPLARSEAFIGELVSFVYGFCRDELHVRIDDRLSSKALDRFYRLKEVGDRIEKDMEESANADAEADDEYFREFERRYAAMSPNEVLQHAANVAGIPIEDVPQVRCRSCGENSLVFLEAGACTNPACRETYQLGTCRCCYECTIKDSYFCICESCRSG